MGQRTNLELWQRAATDWHRRRVAWFREPREEKWQYVPVFICALIAWIVGQIVIGLAFLLRHMLCAINKSWSTRLSGFYSSILTTLVILAAIRVVGWDPFYKVVDNIPVLNSLPDKAVNVYVDEWHEVAIREMHKHGIPASITLAQGMLESGNGKSKLAITARNHFGIKCHKGWRGQSVRMNDDKPDECFRKYDRDEDSFEDHSLFLLKPLYAKLFLLDRHDYKAWARGLKEAGYATDKRYSAKLIHLIERNNLQRFDQM